MAAFKPPGQCPACGEWVTRGSAACDDCGACAKSGWKSDTNIYDGLDLPDEDFDYDDFINREFGRPAASMDRRLFWRIVAAVLLGVMVLGYLMSAK